MEEGSAENPVDMSIRQTSQGQDLGAGSLNGAGVQQGPGAPPTQAGALPSPLRMAAGEGVSSGPAPHTIRAQPPLLL